ncbi:hypothetical protein [Mycoplasma mycoides]|uniref:hypothetical protein n=1 Tax=Mycoplasma mycoides TaxID=2102 RepID=UPI0010197D6C|nr:hypothetical protein [Mycoplasma mycoides]SRX64236.1 hypothetical protein MMC68H_00497 [Mycoplasma mycoides subsp. capri]
MVAGGSKVEVFFFYYLFFFFLINITTELIAKIANIETALTATKAVLLFTFLVCGLLFGFTWLSALFSGALGWSGFDSGFLLSVGWIGFVGVIGLVESVGFGSLGLVGSLGFTGWSGWFGFIGSTGLFGVELCGVITGYKNQSSSLLNVDRSAALFDLLNIYHSF